MFALSGCVLLAMTAVTPVKTASTYDDAACTSADDAAGADNVNADVNTDADAEAAARDRAPLYEGGAAVEASCSQPAPVPAIIDCSDPRAGRYVDDMIGTCDMPRPASPGSRGAPTVGHPGGTRFCDGRCARDAYPVRAAARAADDGSSLMAGAIAILYLPRGSLVALADPLMPPTVDPPPLYHPPRP
jgi:hypothetical protein